MVSGHFKSVIAPVEHAYAQTVKQNLLMTHQRLLGWTVFGRFPFPHSTQKGFTITRLIDGRSGT